MKTHHIERTESKALLTHINMQRQSKMEFIKHSFVLINGILVPFVERTLN